MDKVDKYFTKLINKAKRKCPEGDELFERFDVPSNASGFVIKQYLSKYTHRGKYFILGWNVETTDGNNHRGTRTKASPYVQSYLVFNTESECNKVMLYYIDKDYEVV